MRFNGRLSKLLLLSAVVGCGFTPGQAGPPTGSSSSGTGATNGVGANTGTTGSGGAGLQTGAGGDVGPGSGGSCGQTNVQIKAVPADVLIIQDKSGSMNNDDSDQSCNNGCGMNSKWTQMVGAVSTIVTSTDQQINWGLKFFSDNNACDAGGAPAVMVGPMNGMIIANTLQMTNAGGNTPTRDAVTSGAAALAAVNDGNAKYILLATDGLPNCPVGCASSSRPSSACTQTDNPSEDQAATQAIADALSMDGISTFVIGIGNVATAQNTLNNFAMAGGKPQSGAATSYYAATDPAALEAALATIVGGVISCTVPLNNPPANLSNVAVSATDTQSNGKVAISQDPSNGWSFDANKQNIILNGSACDNLKSGRYTDLNFIYACEGVQICIDLNPDGTCASH